MAKWKFIGNGRIKDPEGAVWFIDGFEHMEDGRSVDLSPINLEDKTMPSLKVRWCLRLIRVGYPIDYLSVSDRQRTKVVEEKYKQFSQIEYFGKEHPLAGQIKSIIF